MIKFCKCCGERLPVRNNVKNYQYCGKDLCQRMRRGRWQRKKLAVDTDYEQSQYEARQKWKAAHPDYMKNYRASHEKYRLRDNEQRRIRRNRARYSSNKTACAVKMTDAVKMNACLPQLPIISGCYSLRPLESTSAVKMDAYTVQLTVIQQDVAP